MNGANSHNDEYGESMTLKSLLGDGSPDNQRIEWFFDTVWQEQCAELRWKNRHRFLPQEGTNEAEETNHWNDDAVKHSPYEEIVRQGWNSLVNLLESHNEGSGLDEKSHVAPLLFKEQTSVTDELETSYHNSLFAAYLDGCSIVLNHADWRCPWIAALCQDLQRSFPHAYANVYITPPAAQAVRAHADDRDVIVFQIAGQKEWTIYKNVPIPHPYPPEQVGKDGLEVPGEVLNGPKLIETTLRPGDALYMPRGYVHEARCNDHDLSFHVTIALATHDWTLAGILTTATEKILHNVVDYRKAINRKIGTRDLKDIPKEEKDHLQKQIHDAFQLLQEQVTVEAMASNLEHKFHRHNHRAYSARLSLIHSMRFPSTSSPNGNTGKPGNTTGNAVVGPKAAKSLSMSSLVRAATEEEKASILQDQPRGLRVRELVADGIISILKALKENTKEEDTEGLAVAVKDLKSLLPTSVDSGLNANLICQLTLISFAKVCVEQGALAMVQP